MPESVAVVSDATEMHGFHSEHFALARRRGFRSGAKVMYTTRTSLVVVVAHMHMARAELELRYILYVSTTPFRVRQKRESSELRAREPRRRTPPIN